MSAIEAVLSNMTSNNSGNGTEMMTGRELTIGDTIIMAVKAVLGTVAAVQNFTIFLLLLMKKKRVVSELLVISNALLDTIMAVIFLVKSTMLTLLHKIPIFYRCVFSYFLYTFLTTASFFLIISISINRYVAVRHCHDYNRIFSKARVRALLSAVVILSFLHSFPEILVCKQEGYCLWYDDYWLFSRVFLVLLCWTVLLGVYFAISDQFSQPFWAPLVRPFAFYRRRMSHVSEQKNPLNPLSKDTRNIKRRSSIMALLGNRKKPNKTKKESQKTECPANRVATEPTDICPTTTHNDDVIQPEHDVTSEYVTTNYIMSSQNNHLKVEVEIEEQNDNVSCVSMNKSGVDDEDNFADDENAGEDEFELDEEIEEGDGMSSYRSPEGSGHILHDQDDSYNSNDNSKAMIAAKQQLAPCQSLPSSRYAKDPSTVNNSNKSKLRNSCDITIHPREASLSRNCKSPNKSTNQNAKKQARKKSFQNQKHKITFSLFLVCLCFIVIIIPQTSIQLINYFTSLPVELILNIYSITEIVYLMNFVINPVIFTYNNGYLMEKLQIFQNKLQKLNHKKTTSRA